MISGWIFLFLIFPHLFTSASLKGMVNTPCKGDASEPLSVEIFRLYPPAIPSQWSENNPCHSPWLTMLQQYLLLSFNMPSSLTSRGLLFSLKLSHHSGISSSITSLRPSLTTPVPLASHALITLFYFLFSHFSLSEIILFVYCPLLLIRAPEKQGFLNCLLLYPQCLEQTLVHGGYWIKIR